MGEKRKYKPRKPGGGRKKLKPEFDAGKNLKEQMESAVALYDSEMSLQAIADELGLNPIKVRKLLITAGVYESDVAEKVKNTFKEYRETQDYKTSILSTAKALNAYPFLDVYRKYRKLEEITRPMVVELIEKIEVYEGNRVEITFRFQDEIVDLLEELHQKQMGQREVSA